MKKSTVGWVNLGKGQTPSSWKTVVDDGEVTERGEN